MTRIDLRAQQVTAAIAISDLSFAYPDRPNLLQNINLQVMPGERLGVVGPNGAGKTTLFTLICGLLHPLEGKVILFGEPVIPGQFRPDIGLVFQNPDDQMFSASVWEDVSFGPQNMGLIAPELNSRVSEALLMTGTQDLVDRLPHHLSGGEKRMVAIATVLAMQPQLVIYDEPSANLDMRSRRRLIKFLQSSKETSLIASHDLELILEVCDRVILLDEGQMIADGKTTVIMGNRPLMEQHGLEMPHSLFPHDHSPFD